MLRKMTGVLVVAVLLSISVLGCSKNGDASDASPQAAAQAADNVNKTGMPIVNEPVTFKIAVKKDPNSPVSWSEKKEVNKYLEEANIHIDWMEIPASGWDEKINLLFASGDLPDAIWGDIKDDTVLKNTASLLPLNDLIDQWAPSLKGFMDERQDVKKAITAPDGNIYGFFYMSEYIDDLNRDKLMVNKKWLDKAGLQVPGTTDEFYAMLKAFKSDMNGNGQADEIPLSFSMDDPDTSMYSLFGSFGVLDNTNHVMVKDGKVLFSPAEPGYYDALQYFHKLYADGLIDKSAFSQTADDYRAKGKTAAPTLGTIIDATSDEVVAPDVAPDYVGIKPLAGPDGARLWNVSDKVPVGLKKNMLVLTKKAKNPEVLARFVDYINSSERNVLRFTYGEENTTWKYDGDVIKKVQDNVPDGMTYSVFTKTFTDVGPFIKDYNINSRLDNTDSGKRRDAMIRANMPYFPKEFVTTTAYEDPDKLTERSALYTDIDKYVRSFMSKAIMEGIDDKGWQDHLDNLKKLKTDRYVELMQDYYNNNKLEDGINMEKK